MPKCNFNVGAPSLRPFDPSINSGLTAQETCLARQVAARSRSSTLYLHTAITCGNLLAYIKYEGHEKYQDKTICRSKCPLKRASKKTPNDISNHDSLRTSDQ